MTLHKPAIPPRARDIIYFTGLIFGFLSVLVAGIAPVAFPGSTVTVLAILGAANSGMLFLTSATGVTFRPGINPTVADGAATPIGSLPEVPEPTEPGRHEAADA